MAVRLLTQLLDGIVKSEEIPEEWRNVLVPVFKTKGDRQSYSNYKEIRLIVNGI